MSYQALRDSVLNECNRFGLHSVICTWSNRTVEERKKAAGHKNESTIDDFSWKGYGMLIVGDHPEIKNDLTIHLSGYTICQVPDIEQTTRPQKNTNLYLRFCLTQHTPYPMKLRLRSSSRSP